MLVLFRLGGIRPARDDREVVVGVPVIERGLVAPHPRDRTPELLMSRGEACIRLRPHFEIAGYELLD
jgi:hypothetical protein